MSALPSSTPDLWFQYVDHVSSNLHRLRQDPVGTAAFISQMGEYFVLQKYSYQNIQELMAHVSELAVQISSTPSNSVSTLLTPVGNQSRSLPNSPLSNKNFVTPQSISNPGTPSGTSRADNSGIEVPTLRTESTRVLVEFDSPSEWYRALEMIRSVEAHRDKMRASGGKSRKPPIMARLLGGSVNFDS